MKQADSRSIIAFLRGPPDAWRGTVGLRDEEGVVTAEVSSPSPHTALEVRRAGCRGGWEGLGGSSERAFVPQLMREGKVITSSVLAKCGGCPPRRLAAQGPGSQPLPPGVSAGLLCPGSSPPPRETPSPPRTAQRPCRSRRPQASFGASAACLKDCAPAVAVHPARCGRDGTDLPGAACRPRHTRLVGVTPQGIPRLWTACPGLKRWVPRPTASRRRGWDSNPGSLALKPHPLP